MDNDAIYKKMRGYALWLLSRQRYSENQLTNKLKQKFKDAETSQIIERLKSLRYLDDQELIRSYVSGKSRVSPRGKIRLKYELQKKGIKEDLFNKVWPKLEVNELQLCKNAFERLIKNKTQLTFEEKEKIAGKLFRKGFSYEVIRGTIYSLPL